MTETWPAGSFVAMLGDEARAALLSAGRDRTYRQNTRIFHQGDRGDYLILIVDGRVKIEATTARGATSVLSVRGRGELVGELAAIDAGARVASAIAVDVLRARVLTAEEFRTLVSGHPSVGLALMKMLMTRLREADRRRIEFGSSDVSNRIAQVLAELAYQHDRDESCAIEVRLSQDEVAAMVGASRESAARALTALRRRGLVDTGRRVITILDPKGLRDLTG